MSRTNFPRLYYEVVMSRTFKERRLMAKCHSAALSCVCVCIMNILHNIMRTTRTVCQKLVIMSTNMSKELGPGPKP